MNQTVFEKGIEKGAEKEGCELVRELLEEKFINLSASVLTKLEQMPYGGLRLLSRAILKANSLRELGLEN